MKKFICVLMFVLLGMAVNSAHATPVVPVYDVNFNNMDLGSLVVGPGTDSPDKIYFNEPEVVGEFAGMYNCLELNVGKPGWTGYEQFGFYLKDKDFSNYMSVNYDFAGKNYFSHNSIFPGFLTMHADLPWTNNVKIYPNSVQAWTVKDRDYHSIDFKDNVKYNFDMRVDLMANLMEVRIDDILLGTAELYHDDFFRTFRMNFGKLVYNDSLGDSSIFVDNIKIFNDPNGVAPVPEPATMFLLGTGLLGMAGLRKKIKG